MSVIGTDLVIKGRHEGAGELGCSAAYGASQGRRMWSARGRAEGSPQATWSTGAARVADDHGAARPPVGERQRRRRINTRPSRVEAGAQTEAAAFATRAPGAAQRDPAPERPRGRAVMAVASHAGAGDGQLGAVVAGCGVAGRVKSVRDDLDLVAERPWSCPAPGWERVGDRAGALGGPWREAEPRTGGPWRSTLAPLTCLEHQGG